MEFNVAEAVVHVGENSPQKIAYELFKLVAMAEKKTLSHAHPENPDRKWILDTYAECVLAVERPYDR
jgi:hypothetical protein